MMAEPALALKSNYRVYASPGSGMISNTSEQAFTLTGKSHGGYRQVSYTSNGKTRYAWVHRYAVDSSSSQAQPQSQSQKVQASNDSTLALGGNYNVRRSAAMSSSVLGNTGETQYKLTGRSQGVWREVVNKDGSKGWVNRMAVTRKISTATTPNTEAAPLPVQKTDAQAETKTDTMPFIVPESTSISPAANEITTSVPTATTTPASVPFTIINPNAEESTSAETTPKTSSTLPSAPAVTSTVSAPAQVPLAPPASPAKKLQDRVSEEITKAGEPRVTSRPVKPMPLTQSSGECNFQEASMKKNCEILMEKVASGELPKEATLFSLRTFKETYQSYCDGNQIQNKVRNNCSFFFSNLDGVYKGNGYRHPAYLIDLCAGTSKSSSKQVVTPTYTNRGTGSGAGRSTANYSDRGSAKTTLAGVFRTGELTGFDPYDRSKGKYRKMLGYSESDPNCDGTGNYRNNFLAKCKVIRLSLSRIGGSSTDDSKPMHTSPFNSSSGCPSMGLDQNYIMRKLASRGTSLYIAYTKQASQKSHFEAPKRSCVKDPDVLNNPLGAGLLASEHSGLQ